MMSRIPLADASPDRDDHFGLPEPPESVPVNRKAAFQWPPDGAWPFMDCKSGQRYLEAIPRYDLNLGTFGYAAAAVPPTFVKLCIACVNCESTSSAIVMTSGSSKLKSSALRLLCNVPNRVTCSIRESCTSMAGV